MPLMYVNPDGEKMFDLEKSVGRNAPNNRMDVKMVQYMLREIYSAGFATPPSPVPLAVDAWIGPTTVTWITKFQVDVNRYGQLHSNPAKVPPLGPKCAIDGRVDAMTIPCGKSPTTNLYFTITWLNVILQDLNRAAFENVPNVVPCMPSSPGTRPNPYTGPAYLPTTGGG